MLLATSWTLNPRHVSFSATRVDSLESQLLLFTGHFHSEQWSFLNPFSNCLHFAWPTVRVFLKHPFLQNRHLIGYSRVIRRGQIGDLREVFIKHVAWGLTDQWRPARDHFIKSDSKAINIRAVIHGIAAHLLRGHVTNGS